MSVSFLEGDGQDVAESLDCAHRDLATARQDLVNQICATVKVYGTDRGAWIAGSELAVRNLENRVADRVSSVDYLTRCIAAGKYVD